MMISQDRRMLRQLILHCEADVRQPQGIRECDVPTNLEFIIDKKFVIAHLDPMKLRNHIKQHRARLDLTQEDLARRVGVRRQTILAIEKGKFVPSALLAFQLAEALGMPVAELFELDAGEGGHDG